MNFEPGRCSGGIKRYLGLHTTGSGMIKIGASRFSASHFSNTDLTKGREEI